MKITIPKKQGEDLNIFISENFTPSEITYIANELLFEREVLDSARVSKTDKENKKKK